MFNLLFFGSDNFPNFILENLTKTSKIKIIGLVTAADFKEKNLVREKAFQLHIPIFTPLKYREESKEILSKTKPDIIVVCNYGQFLDNSTLTYPKYGCLNIHCSLLPILRGACPIEMAIIQGLSETGVTIQLLDEHMDTGEIIAQKKVNIDTKETGGSLRKKLQDLASTMTPEITIEWIEGKIKPKVQDSERATYCYRKDISKEAARIKWNEPAAVIERKIRAFNPKPTAWTLCTINNKQQRIKILEAKVSTSEIAQQPGTMSINNNKMSVSTGKGRLEPLHVQLEGRKIITIEEFLRGIRGELKIG